MDALEREARKHYWGNRYPGEMAYDESTWLLKPENSYLKDTSSALNPAGLWNGLALELLGILDILTCLLRKNLSHIDIRGFRYRSNECASVLIQRSTALLDILRTPLHDDIRNKTMLGLREPLDGNYVSLAGKPYYHQFHAYSAMEPLARLVALNHEFGFGIPDSFANGANGLFSDMYDQFWPEWEGIPAGYVCPAETRYQELHAPPVVRCMAYNRLASIGASMLWQFHSAPNNRIYRDRVCELIAVISAAIDSNDVWQYSRKTTPYRPEDPGHGVEVVRFLAMADDAGFPTPAKKFASRWRRDAMSPDMLKLRRYLVPGEAITNDRVGDFAVRYAVALNWGRP